MPQFINQLPMRPTPNQSSYIEDGYNMILTEAPKDLGGRLFLNLARTMPELPCRFISHYFMLHSSHNLPCVLLIVPQMTLIFDPLTSFDAR